MSGTPLWCRSKCSPLGVSMPSSDSSGEREAPLPVVPGCERMSVRVTLLSYFAGLPYSPIPAPGTFIDGGISGGSAAALLTPPAASPLASSPTLRLMKRRLDRSTVSPLPFMTSRHLRTTGDRATRHRCESHRATARVLVVARAELSCRPARAPYA